MRDPQNERDSDRSQRPPSEPDRGDEARLDDEELIDEAAMDSFPASDPPSWSPTRAGDPHPEERGEERPDRDRDS